MQVELAAILKNLSLSTKMSLGASALIKVSGAWEGIIRAGGGIHGNPASSHDQWHRDTVAIGGILTNPILTRAGW